MVKMLALTLLCFGMAECAFAQAAGYHLPAVPVGGMFPGAVDVSGAEHVSWRHNRNIPASVRDWQHGLPELELPSWEESARQQRMYRLIGSSA